MSRDNLISLGTNFGKFTKTKKFRLHITALDFLAPYATHKVWLKSSAEQQFLYGHNVSKSGLGRITEDTDKYQGVVVYSMSDLPLGFGVAARSTAECRHADPLTVVCFQQADIGEYIRAEATLTWINIFQKKKVLFLSSIQDLFLLFIFIKLLGKLCWDKIGIMTIHGIHVFDVSMCKHSINSWSGCQTF